ncbi:phycobilisome rod-core linker polypeptide [Synechococcus sp. BSF8S]|uniref:phycobilisome rod-core linker polypeptide n=1 Tax=unclassified Synechococcus TaxID=2626047 RepID=UPI00351C4879
MEAELSQSRKWPDPSRGRLPGWLAEQPVHSFLSPDFNCFLFAMPVITRQATTSVQDYAHARMVLRSAYRQVFGNAHLMDEELVSTAESLFLQGDLAVQGLVAALACSDTYRRLFLDKNGPYRFVELNFKHLLGRAPRDQAEVSEHVQRLANEGYEAEIASYVYSPEYIGAFGFDTVPYWRTTHTQTGESNLTYTRSLKLKGGEASFDGSSSSKLQVSLATGDAPSVAVRGGRGGSTNRNDRRFRINWTTASPSGLNRRAVQVSIVPFSSLTSTLQSLQRRGGSIVSVTND